MPLCCITTPSTNPTGIYLQLLEANKTKFNGKHVFKYVEITFVCEACRRDQYRENKKNDPSKTGELRCPHMAHRLPPWQSEEKLGSIGHLTKALGREDHMREQHGLVFDANDTAFARDDIERLFLAPPYPSSEREIGTIFVTIDPNTGKFDSRAKAGSDFAMLSGYYAGDRFVIMGMEALEANHPKTFIPDVVDHLRALRAPLRMKNARIVMIMENNLARETQWLSDHIASNTELSNLVWVKRTELREGVYTDNALKRNMAGHLRRMMDNGNVMFAQRLICVGRPADSPHGPGSEENVRFVRDILKTQMQRFREIKIAPKDPYGVVKVFLTGKTAHGAKDDLVMVLMMALWFSTLYWQDPNMAVKVLPV